jgi:O-antigen/teichoic acid export membrane protein
MACFSHVIMTTLFRRDILHASDAFNVLAAGGIAFFVAYLNLHVLAGINLPRAAAACVVAGLGVDLLSNPLLTYHFGIRGAAIAGVAGYGTTAGIGLYLLRRELPFRLPIRAFFGTAGLCILLVFLCLRFRETAPFASAPFVGALAFCGFGLAAGLVALEVVHVTRLRETVRLLRPGSEPRGLN